MNNKDKGMFNKIIYYNCNNNGDLHYSRQFIKDFIAKLPQYTHGLMHNKCPQLMIDVAPYYGVPDYSTNILQRFIKNDVLYLNTYVAQNGFVYGGTKHNGCNLRTNYALFTEHADFLGIELDGESEYIPQIDYSCYNIQKQNYINKILISNGPVLSGQSENFDFTSIIDWLSEKYPHVNFFLTHPTAVKKENIINLNDITGDTGGCNLNEISQFSLSCDIIIGRGSGPMCFCHVRENILDSDKIFVTFGNNEDETNWVNENFYKNLLTKCKRIWSNNYDIASIYKICDETIYAKFGNR